MQHFVVILPVEPLVIGQSSPVERWPLHVTLIPNFRTRSNWVDVETAIGSMQSPALGVRVDGEEMFGPSGSISVNIVFDDSGALAQLHNRLLTTLEEQCGLTLEAPQYFRDGYRAHITATSEARAEPGALIQLNQVALVDMQSHGDAGNPTVISTINLFPRRD